MFQNQTLNITKYKDRQNYVILKCSPEPLTLPSAQRGAGTPNLVNSKRSLFVIDLGQEMWYV